MKKYYVSPTSDLIIINSADVLLLSMEGSGFGMEVDYSEFGFID